MKKVIGYLRVSTTKQAAEGVSLANQADRIGAYCQYKGIELVDILEDAGVSGGKNRGRPGFMDLLDRIEQGDIDIIILYSLERLSRDMLTLLALERLLEEQDVELHTIEGQIDTSTPDGWMNFATKALFGELERRNVKYRTKKAMEHKKAKGEVVGSVPYGYRRVGRGLVADLNEQAVVKAVNTLYGKGKRLVDVVTALNDQGKVTRAGKAWTPTQIKRLVSDYRGSFKKSQTRVSTATRQFIEAIG